MGGGGRGGASLHLSDTVCTCRVTCGGGGGLHSSDTVCTCRVTCGGGGGLHSSDTVCACGVTCGGGEEVCLPVILCVHLGLLVEFSFNHTKKGLFHLRNSPLPSNTSTSLFR